MKSIITILFSLLIGMMLAGCEDKDTVSVDERVLDVNATEPIETAYQWPRVIVDSGYEYVGENIKERALADGLMAWGICMAGNKPPDNFGLAMVKIGKIVGVLATPENLMEAANR